MSVCTANIYSSCYLIDSSWTKNVGVCVRVCVHVSVFGTGCQVQRTFKIRPVRSYL